MQVIFETSRLATIVNGVLRKTTKEMVLNGEHKKVDTIFLKLQLLLSFWAEEAVSAESTSIFSQNFFVSIKIMQNMSWK